MRIYCESGGAHRQTAYNTQDGKAAVCSQCGMSTEFPGFWTRHALTTDAATQIRDEQRRHSSTLTQLRDARELLNQVNQELAELGDENYRLRAEVAHLRSKQFHSSP